MDFAPTEASKIAVRRIAREFGERVLAPKAAARDLSGEFPAAELRELGELGLLAINVPEELGGASAMGTVAYSLAMQEIARADAAVAVALSVTNMVAELIATHGSPELARRWVPRIASGELVCGAFALSEAEAGSDPAAMRTVATKTAHGWRLSGTKQWITSGDRAGCMVVWAVTDPGGGPEQHLGVRRGRQGARPHGRAGSGVEKLGIHGSSTAALVLELAWRSRTATCSARSAAVSRSPCPRSTAAGSASPRKPWASRAARSRRRSQYAKDRVTFGQPIIKHQAIAMQLADAATWLDAAHLMTLRAAKLKQDKLPFAQQAAMAKLFASEHGWRICDIALQIHGGYGYVRDFPVERALRDIRVTRIYEGTSEIQRS